MEEKEKQAEIVKSSSPNPLLQQIQKGIQLKKTNINNKQYYNLGFGLKFDKHLNYKFRIYQNNLLFVFEQY